MLKCFPANAALSTNSAGVRVVKGCFAVHDLSCNAEIESWDSYACVVLRLYSFCPPGDLICSLNTTGARHPHSVTFHLRCSCHSRGFVSSIHRLLSLSLHFASLSVCRLSVRQLHFALVCDGAPEELGGYARAGPGLQRVPGHRSHVGEGEANGVFPV